MELLDLGIGVIIIIGLIALLVIIWVLAGFKIVRQSEAMVIERLGKYSRTLSAGINIILPIIDRPKEIMWRFIQKERIRQDFRDKGISVGRIDEMDSVGRVRRADAWGRSDRLVNTIDLRETVYDFPKQHVITRDNVVTEIDAMLYFQVMDPVKATYEITNLPVAIEKLTQTTLRNVIGEMELDQTLTSRDTINSKLRAVLDDACQKWGVKVNRVELQEIIPPPDIVEAMKKQMIAEREKRETILAAEGEKAKRTLEAEGNKTAKINEAEAVKQSEILKAEAMLKVAEAEKQSKILIADGEAYAKLKVAEAEAAANEAIISSVKENTSDPVNYLVAVEYITAFKELASGKDNKVVYLPFEATSILSSIGGIKDLLGVTKK